jgi:hypothetical protein
LLNLLFTDFESHSQEDTSMKNRWTWMLVAAVLLVAAFSLSWSRAAEARHEAFGDQHKAPGPGFDFQALVDALNGTPGCLGVEVAQFQSGKLTIFAWFEDKAAVMRWYRHPVHRGAAEAFFPSGTGSRRDSAPLAHLSDESGPIMVAATITPNRTGNAGQSPISQISVELYEPLPGGLSAGGRLAPLAVNVPHMIDVDRRPGMHGR